MKKQDFNKASEGVRDTVAGLPMAEDGPLAEREEEVQRYSPTALMFKNRVILLHGEVNAQMAYNVIAQVKHLEAASPTDPITFLINSPGGSVIDGLAILDVVRGCKCPVVTIGNGMQASMGSIFLSMGDQRFMTPNANLMLHQISSGTRGQATDIEISAGFSTYLHESLKNVYVSFTGLNHKFWDKVLERDTWLSPEQAKKIGFIHDILQPEKALGKYAAEAKREKTDSLTQVVLDKIASMSKNEVIDALNNGQANNAEFGRYRPELVVRLAEFPEYWTKLRRAEAKLAGGKATIANDDKPKAVAPSAKKAPAFKG